MNKLFENKNYSLKKWFFLKLLLLSIVALNCSKGFNFSFDAERDKVLKINGYASGQFIIIHIESNTNSNSKLKVIQPSPTNEQNKKVLYEFDISSGEVDTTFIREYYSSNVIISYLHENATRGKINLNVRFSMQSH